MAPIRKFLLTYEVAGLKPCWSYVSNLGGFRRPATVIFQPPRPFKVTTAVLNKWHNSGAEPPDFSSFPLRVSLKRVVDAAKCVALFNHSSVFLQHMGKSHEETGLSSFPEGELTLLCDC